LATMLVRLPHVYKSTQQRAMYIVCMCFVFSYIAFDVLDLDGSDLPSLLATLERSSIVAVVPSQVEIPCSSDRVEHARTIAALVADAFAKYARFQTTRVPASPLLAVARAHGSRIGLARDDLPD
jgi:hypothetical protein